MKRIIAYVLLLPIVALAACGGDDGGGGGYMVALAVGSGKALDLDLR